MRILGLDIETAPHRVFAWGLWDQNIHIDNIVQPGYTLCWAAKWFGKKKVYFNSVHESSAEDMIKEIYGLIEEADAVVHYNGTKFDMPTLAQEFLTHDLPPPTPYSDIDLLKVVRKRFRLPSNKLDYVARYLGIDGKVKHMGMQLWRDCMEGCPKAWKVMKRYNIQDVRLLEDVYTRILPWIHNHPNWGLYTDADKPTCRNCGSTNVVKNGIERSVTLPYQRYRCQDCRTPLKARKSLQRAPEGILK